MTLTIGVDLVVGQVKRVLRPGGKYACVTQAQNNVLGYSQYFFRFSLLRILFCPIGFFR